MTRIDNLTNSADQTTTLILPDNTAATLRLRFRARTKRWIADVGYAGKSFQVYGMNVCCFPNIMRSWRDILPFGIAFMTADFTDPFDINDFISGRCQVFLLNSADVAAVENDVIGSPA